MKDNQCEPEESLPLTNQEYRDGILKNYPWHVVHALICFYITPLWVIGWVLSTASGCEQRNKFHKRFGVQQEPNDAGDLALAVALIVILIFIGAGFIELHRYVF
jgi:hypothetical protein